MLLNKPWFKDAKVTHDWGNNMIIIQGNGNVKTITMTKHLGINLKRPKSYYVLTIRMASHMKKKKVKAHYIVPF